MSSTGILKRALLALVLVGGIALAFVYRDRIDAATLQDWVAGAGVAGPLLFMVLDALGTVPFLPGSLLTLAGGALFGPLWGTFYNRPAPPSARYSPCWRRDILPPTGYRPASGPTPGGA